MKTIDDAFVEFYGQVASCYGVDSIVTTIFAILYIEPGSLSMDELAKKTGFSLSSISNKLKFMESAGFLIKFKKPGSKKVFVRVEKNFVKILKEHLFKKDKIVIQSVKKKIPLIIEKYKGTSNSKKEKEKIEILQNYYKTMLKFEKFLGKMMEELDSGEYA